MNWKVLIALVITVFQWCMTTSVQAQVYPLGWTDPKPDFIVEFLTVADRSEFLVIYNDDGSVRGGAYNISFYGGIYLTSLHTLAGSRFIELNKELYRFYGFNSISEDFFVDYANQKANGSLKELVLKLKWIDVVLIVDRHRFPEGIKNEVVKAALQTLANRQLYRHSVGYALQGIIPHLEKPDEFVIRTNQGDLIQDLAAKKLYLKIDSNKTSLREGSSGTLVVGRTSDLLEIKGFWDTDFSSVVPVGMVKCKVSQSLVRKNHILYEIQNFNFLNDPSIFPQELFKAPPKIIEPDCKQYNGRGQGGI